MSDDGNGWVTLPVQSDSASAVASAPAEPRWITLPPPKDEHDEPKQESWSPAQGFGRGIMDPTTGAAQLISKAGGYWGDPELAQQFPFSAAPPVPMMAPSETQKAIETQEENYQEGRKAAGDEGVDYWRVAGNLASPSNFVGLGAAGSALGRLGLGAATGAVQSASMPVYGDHDFWNTKLEQFGFGAGFGAAGTTLGAALLPRASSDARTLMADFPSEYALTPGMQAPSIMRRAEESLKDKPITGSFIRAAEDRALEGFNVATINKALAPVGSALPKGAAAGHDALGFMQDAISEKYNTLLPKVHLVLDRELGNDFDRIITKSREMPRPQIEQFDNIVDNSLFSRLQNDGIAGEELKKVESDLGNAINRYSSSSVAGERDLANNLRSLRGAIRENLERSNPTQAQQLKNINTAYALAARVQNAATRRATSEGKFSAGDLLQSLKSADTSANDRVFARGDALLQPWAETANRVLKNRLPNSGTPERMGWGSIFGHGGTGAVLGALAYENPHLITQHPIVSSAVLSPLVTGLGMGLPYTRTGAKIMGPAPAAARGILGNLAAPAGGIVGQAPAMQYSWPNAGGP